MKKLLLFLCALGLLCTNRAWAETPSILALPQPGKIYYIAGYYENNGSPLKVYLYANSSSLAANVSYTEAGEFAYLWLCAKSGDGYTFQNLSTGTYLKGPGTSANPSLNATATVFSILNDEVQNANCISFRTGTGSNSRWTAVNFTDGSPNRLDGSYNNTTVGGKNWTTDFLLEEYAAKTLSHNQYYYIYCDNDDSPTTGTDRPQYIYNNEGSFYLQTDKSQVSLTNYAWRAQQLRAGHFSFKNGAKYMSFHTLADAAYDWQIDKEDAYGTGRVMLWGVVKERYMLQNNASTSTPNTGGFSQTKNFPKSGEWSQDYMFVVAPQTNVYRVAIQVEGGSEANAVFTYDGINYSGDCSVYVDGNNLPETKTISLSSSNSEYTFKGFYLEDGTSLGTTIDVSAWTANKGIKAVFYPFKLSTDFANANWYYMKVGGKWAYYYDSDKCAATSTKSDAVNTADNACWAFIANGSGINIINRAAGDGNYLDSNNSLIKFVSDPSGLAIWTYRVQDGGFSFDNDNYYLYSDDDNYLHWNNGAYISSALITVEDIDWKELAKAFVDKYTNTHAKDKYFGVSQTTADSYQTTIDNTEDYGKANYEVLCTYASSLLPITYPENGYYRIKSSGARDIGTSYIGYGQPSYYSAGLITVSEANAATDASTIIQFTKNPSNQRQFAFSTQGLNVQSQTTVNTAFPASADAGVYFTFTVQNVATGAVSINNAASANTGSDANVQGNLHEAGWTVPGVVNWNATATPSQWTIEDAEEIAVSLTAVGDYTYTTLSLPFGVTLPENVKAYILKVEDGWAVPYEISGVPAGTGVLLRGTTSSVTSATLTINDEASATTTGNMLSPTYVDITSARSAGEYILSTKDGVIGFYQRGSGKKIGANKAYLKLDADISDGGEVKGIMLNWGEVDAVKALDNGGRATETIIYDMSGRRVSQPSRGLYIVNGKKVSVK